MGMWPLRKQLWGGEDHGMGNEGRTNEGGAWISRIVPVSGGSRGGGGGRCRRGCLALALICFSPILLPLICLSLPLLCVAAFCLRLQLQRRSKSQAGPRKDGGGRFPVRCKEGEAAMDEQLLLHRYLEDQLGLVGAVWDYDDGDGC